MLPGDLSIWNERERRFELTLGTCMSQNLYENPWLCSLWQPRFYISSKGSEKDWLPKGWRTFTELTAIAVAIKHWRLFVFFRLILIRNDDLTTSLLHTAVYIFIHYDLVKSPYMLRLISCHFFVVKRDSFSLILIDFYTGLIAGSN